MTLPPGVIENESPYGPRYRAVDWSRSTLLSTDCLAEATRAAAPWQKAPAHTAAQIAAADAWGFERDRMLSKGWRA